MAKSKERLRGVRASRLKLNSALSQSSLSKKTQAAVAEKIADNEGLETVPKDLVNRIFREHSVDPQSIQRVAKVLGVDAHTLYQTEKDPVVAPFQPSPPTKRIFLLSIPAILIFAVLLFFSRDTPYVCEFQSFLRPTKVAENKLGIYVARFANDFQGEGQDLISKLFSQDKILSPILSVVNGCEEFSDLGHGDTQQLLTATRTKAQSALKKTGAHIVLWGYRFGNILKIHFTSENSNSVYLHSGDDKRSIAVDEPFVELLLDLTDPAATSAELKELALSLMHPKNEKLLRIRDDAQVTFVTSFDWLRRSILADRNLRSSLDPERNQQQWAIISAQLCYKYRLLGDYSGNSDLYHQAINACEGTLKFRRREQYPLDWSATKNNLASAQTRLAMYADSTDQAISRLETATSLLEEAASEIDKSITPQRWVTNRRNLGTAHLRLASLTAGEVYRQHFGKATELLELSLHLQDPLFQPLDWADTHNNLCALKHHYGSRTDTGADVESRIKIVRESIAHCEEAIRWLSPSTEGFTWARVQNNLAASNAVLAELTNDQDHLVQARSAFLRAQEVYTLESYPLNWAEVEVNLGQLHCSLAKMMENRSLLKRAREHTEQAMEIFLKKGHRYAAYTQDLLDAILHCEINQWADCKCEA